MTEINAWLGGLRIVFCIFGVAMLIGWGLGFGWRVGRGSGIHITVNAKPPIDVKSDKSMDYTLGPVD